MRWLIQTKTQPVETPAPPPLTVDMWVQPTNQPVFRPSWLGLYQAQTLDLSPAEVVLLDWFAPIGIPLVPPKFQPPAGAEAPAQPAEVITMDKWFSPPSLPPTPPLFMPLMQTETPLSPLPDFGWWTQSSEPRPGLLQTPLPPALSWDSSTPGVVTLDMWMAHQENPSSHLSRTAHLVPPLSWNSETPVGPPVSILRTLAIMGVGQ